jgi:hypothetical protein
MHSCSSVTQRACAAITLARPAVWEVHEQVAVAAMEAGCKQLALRLVQNVHKRFPEGARASRLTVSGSPAACGGAVLGAAP